MTLLAFHDKQEIKEKYLSRVKMHRELDNLRQKTTWENGKGCAIGCTLEAYDHKLYPIELGIPEWLARLEDTIFEGLTPTDSKLWPERFLQAIEPGVDLEKIKAPFIIYLLEQSLQNFDQKKFPDVKAAIDRVTVLWYANPEGPSAARSAAESAAWSAAESAAAWSAAESAAWSAARSAAWSAARSAAWSAARSAARSAAWSAARSAAYSKYADKLIELIEAL